MGEVVFRDSVASSTVREVASLPASLSDCVSRVRRVHEDASQLSADPPCLGVAGECGGANLTPPTRMKMSHERASCRRECLFALGPFSFGRGPDPAHPSSRADVDLLSGRRGDRTVTGPGATDAGGAAPLRAPAAPRRR